MEQNKLTPEQEVVVDDVLATTVAILGAHLNMDPMKLEFEHEVKTLFNDQVYEFASALLDIHIYYVVTVDYDPDRLFDMFKTIHDVCDYFASAVLVKQNLL